MSESNRNAIGSTRSYLVAIGMLFVLGTALSLLDGIREIREERRQLAISRASTLSRTIYAVRRWAMEHGRTPANVAGTSRDNPSIPMTGRSAQNEAGNKPVQVDHVSLTQFMETILRPEGFHVRLVSRTTSHRENLPDNEWERSSLEKFAKGSMAEHVLAGSSGDRVFRYMEPLKVEAACLRCHGHQGYQIGDVRGAISIAFPYTPFDRFAQRAEWREAIQHLLSLGIALAILLFLGRRIEELMRSLQESQRRVRTLEGILPMCANCKKIRKEGAEATDPSAWVPVASYITGHSEAQVSHGICPECMEKLYGPGGSLTES